MRLEELVNKYYDKLNENDKMIWQYIQANKKKCCDISIEELAEICCISSMRVLDWIYTDLSLLVMLLVVSN